MAIEKNIFQFSPTRALSPKRMEIVLKMKSKNPLYTYSLYTLQEMDDFVRTQFFGNVSRYYDRLETVEAKVQCWKYLVLYHYGGVFLEMDHVLQKPIDHLIREGDSAILLKEEENLTESILLFEKGHPLLKKKIEWILEKNASHQALDNTLQSFHQESFGNKLCLRSIRRYADISFQRLHVQYRILGRDSFPYKKLLFPNDEKETI